MAEQPSSLDARLAIVERALADVDHRLRDIEIGVTPLPARALSASEAPVMAMPRLDVVGTSALVGRAFVLIAGAYLLRALTEAGALNRASGAALGLTYALALAALAFRTAPLHRASATWFGGCAVLISFPLLWEITTRLPLLSPPMSAVALTAATAIVLAVAWRRDLHALAWIVTIGACLAASGLLITTRLALPFSIFLILLGIAALWLGYDREWTGLRWAAAGFANLSIIALIDRALATPPLDSPASVMTILMLSLIGYLGSIAIRTLVRTRNVLPFEAVQTAALLTINLVGSVWIARQTGAGALMLGPALLSLTIACYAVAFIHREWLARAANYYFYTTLALVFAITSGNYLLTQAPAGILWSLLAVGMSWLARRHGRTTLQLHALVYLLVGAWTTGLASALAAMLFGPSPASSAAIATSGWLVAAAVPACWWMAAASSSTLMGRAPRAMLMLLLVFTIAGVGVMTLLEVLIPFFDVSLQPALTATTRTGVVAAGAVLAARLGRRPATREFTWLVYPLLGWALLKLLFEDFRVSPPQLLFVALALYGVALIVAPRLAKRTE